MAGRRSESKIRGQVITPRSRRVDRLHFRRQRIDLSGLLDSARSFAKPSLAIVALAVLIIGYNALAGSPLFSLKQVEVNGATDSLHTEVERTVQREVGQTKLLDVELAKIRQKLQALPRIRDASVARILPDKIRVEVEERQPAVLARRKSGSLVWLDADAVELGELSSFKEAGARDIPPVAKGFSEGDRWTTELADDRERIRIYKQIEREFREGRNSIWELVDEVDLNYPKDVNLSLARSSVTVHVGSTDFRNRFETALKMLDAIKRGDSELMRRYRVQDPERLIENAGRIAFIDAARPERVVINFSTASAEKGVGRDPKVSQPPKTKEKSNK